jgi:DNA-3-methyladenine glycosylase
MTKPTALDPLPEEFYLPSARQVAPRLLGHYLLRRQDGELLGGEIVETEAYLVEDPACHGAAGLTQRNRVMFGPPGRAYVYFIYGCHFCVNAVCCAEGVAEAVLIRAIAPTFGLEKMLLNRPGPPRALGNGPGKLCQALQITRPLDGTDLTTPDSSIIIARNSEWKKYRRDHGPVQASTRIGITRAAELSLRFFLQRSPFVSR